MIPLFVSLSSLNVLMLAMAGGLGYAVTGARGSTAHQLAGVAATITCCAVHCIVFTYFVATAKWIQHAIHIKRLEPSLAKPTHSFRAQAFPAAMLAIASVIVAAVLGVATFSGYFRTPLWHHLAAIAALVVNLLAAVVEFRAIRRNGALIDELLARMGVRP